MAIPFLTPSKTFTSRTAAKNYIRDEILRGYPLRARIPIGAHHQLLCEVLELHSHADEKIGSGIDYFYVQETRRLAGREAVGRNQRAIIVVRSDGTERDWSYHHVIDNPSAAGNVKSALASSLETSRLERRDADFASGEPIICALTGGTIAQKHQADTRHLNPTWNTLTTGFVLGHGGWEAIETHSGKNAIFVGRDVEDREIRDSWLSYYAEHARPVYVKNEQLVRD